MKTSTLVVSIAGAAAMMVDVASAFVIVDDNTSFITAPATATTTTGTTTTALFAKTAKKNKKKKKAASASTTTGGFGKAPAVAPPARNTRNDHDDFAAFPPLEPSVAQTLLKSPEPLLEPGCLTEEVYQRLDQIYGFPDFNYDDETKQSTSPPSESDQALSLDDLISSVTGSDSGGGSGGDFSDLLPSSSSKENFSDLLGVDDSSTPRQRQQQSQSSSSTSTIDAISKLPPFQDFRVLHMDPLVIAVDDFFTHEECDRYVNLVAAPSSPNKGDNDNIPFQTRSQTVGKDAQAKAQRTSTTWFNHYKAVPELMAKATRLLGLESIDRWEEPQIVRYRRNEKFTWHLDALSPEEAKPELGGQRLATLLVYLTDLSEDEGGATMFRDLAKEEGSEKADGGPPLKVRPKKGTALVFFPAAGGIPNTPFDIRTLHCGEAVAASSSTDKWISQLWLRESQYTPTAPPGNSHGTAKEPISIFCNEQASEAAVL